MKLFRSNRSQWSATHTEREIDRQTHIHPSTSVFASKKMSSLAQNVGQIFIQASSALLASSKGQDKCQKAMANSSVKKTTRYQNQKQIKKMRILKKWARRKCETSTIKKLNRHAWKHNKTKKKIEFSKQTTDDERRTTKDGRRTTDDRQ